jgi:N-acetyl sugar amidotransferase
VNELVACSRCVLDSSVPSIRFDENGVCNYCDLHDRLEAKYALNEANRARFNRLLEKVRSRGEGKRYDCIVGLSGGTDSTYCLYTVSRLGLRPLAVHMDNGWVSEGARDNIAKAVTKLGVDLKTVTPDWEALRGYYRACLKASIPETCLPCEIGVISTLYETAAQENIDTIVLGTSFRTEGINPLRWNYVDGAYFDDVIRRFGDADAELLPGFNRLKRSNLLYYALVRRIQTVQLPLYMEYHRADIQRTLERELGWTYGGREHFDCLYKPLGAYVEKRKFERDPTKIAVAALVRSGQVTRDDAWEMLKQDSASEPDIAYALERLGLSHADLQAILAAEPLDFRHYRTYYSIFQRFRMPVKMCCRLSLLPETLYEKFFELV